MTNLEFEKQNTRSNNCTGKHSGSKQNRPAPPPFEPLLSPHCQATEAGLFLSRTWPRGDTPSAQKTSSVWERTCEGQPDTRLQLAHLVAGKFFGAENTPSLTSRVLKKIRKFQSQGSFCNNHTCCFLDLGTHSLSFHFVQCIPSS